MGREERIEIESVYKPDGWKKEAYTLDERAKEKC